MKEALIETIQEYEDKAVDCFHISFDCDREVWTIRCDINWLGLYLEDKMFSTYQEAMEVYRIFLLRALNHLLSESGIVPTLPIKKVRDTYEANLTMSLSEIMYLLIEDFQKAQHKKKGGSHE